MPARSSRRKKSNVQVQPSPTPSPPTQLPTPLPEEEPISSGLHRPVISDQDTTTPLEAMDVRLIDFDTPTPPPQRYVHPPPEDPTLDIDPLRLEDDEDEGLAQTYRSPPFREAHLPDIDPEDSPPPLPVPPRGVHDEHGGSSMESSSSSGGHTRWPTYPRSNTHAILPTSLPNPPSRRSPSPYTSNIQSSQSSSTFHSLTRTLRSYVPSSIHIPIPSAAPSPPLVSRPVSFGRFTSDSRMDTNSGLGLGLDSKGITARSRKVVSRQEFERDYEREGTDGEEYYQYGAHGYGYGYGQGPEQQQHQRPPASGLARAMVQNRQPGFDTSAPIPNSSSTASASVDKSSGRADAMDVIIWARWDVLGDRRFLILAYSTGLQIWDCANLSSISEVLNLNFDSAEWKMVLGSGNRGSTRRHEEGMTAQVIHAALLPALSEARSGVKDSFAADRPLLGILMHMDHIEEEHREESHSSFVLYSLRNHQLVKRLALSGSPITFAANDQFIILSMSSPPALIILSSTTFQTLHTIPSASLELFSPLAYSTTTSTVSSTTLGTHSSQSSPAQSPITSSKPVSLARLSIDNATHDNQHRRRQHHLSDPRPVFALSHRLLAYASPSPSSSSSPLHLPSSSSIKSNHHPLSPASSTPSDLSSSPSPFGLGLGSGPIGIVNMNLGKVTNMTQADLGHAALKVGETVLGGMKLLGGMAYGAARSRVSGGGGSGETARVSRGGDGLISGGIGGRFVSRSAPDTSPVIVDENDEVAVRERRFSNTSSVSGYHVTTVAPSTKSSIGASGGYYITVVDLSPLLATVGVSGKRSSTGSTTNPSSVVSPAKVDEFMSSRSQPIADLHFSADGMNLAVIQRDGYVVKTFKIRPIASVAGGSRMDRGDNSETEKRKHWSSQQVSNSSQMYTLRRGRTSAVVEGADWSKDGRWLAIGTRKRTVHVFPINPYGGKTDIASHLEGRVKNVDVINHPLTELSPLIRLRGTRQNSLPEHANAPIAFTFISPLDVSQSPRLLPQQHIPISRTTTSSPTRTFTQSKQAQFQDVLLFNPADGVLSLRRLTLDKHIVREQGLGMVASVQALGVTSISLPGMGGAGKLAGSPSRSGGGGNNNKPSSAMDPPVVELVAQESTVATWHLQRRTDWVEIKQPIIGLDAKPQTRLLGGDWLSQAELTTCSNSRHVLPRSIYLSHQFSFHTLCEDYHALIRRHQLDICGEKIQVRKQVEISAHSSGNNNTSSAAFIEGFSAPRDIRRMSSSFDEPIASAISGSFDNSNLPTILPMYPNGIPGSKPKSFRNSIPIRTMAGIGDGVSESLGRIRREMHKVRSPQLLPRSDSSMSGPVPLEFDEEDEDFQARDDVEDHDGRGLQVPITTRHRDEPSSTSRGTSREGRGGTSAASTSSQDLVTPADASIHHPSQHHLPLVDDSDVVGTVDEEIWSANGWDQQDELAIDEAEQFDDIAAVGYLDEERERTAAAATVMPVLNSKRKGRQRRK